jgi:hypothetical protein
MTNLRSGAVRYHGPSNQADPPLVVLPLQVEPSKPRLIEDARFVFSLRAVPLPCKAPHTC